MEQGFSVITQKMIQTGCKNIADDLLVHRKIQGIGFDGSKIYKGEHLVPYLFEYPCSPHLAAKTRRARKLMKKLLKNPPHFWQKNMIMCCWRGPVG